MPPPSYLRRMPQSSQQRSSATVQPAEVQAQGHHFIDVSEDHLDESPVGYPHRDEQQNQHPNEPPNEPQDEPQDEPQRKPQREPGADQPNEPRDEPRDETQDGQQENEEEQPLIRQPQHASYGYFRNIHLFRPITRRFPGIRRVRHLGTPDWTRADYEGPPPDIPTANTSSSNPSSRDPSPEGAPETPGTPEAPEAPEAPQTSEDTEATRLVQGAPPHINNTPCWVAVVKIILLFIVVVTGFSAAAFYLLENGYSVIKDGEL